MRCQSILAPRFESIWDRDVDGYYCRFTMREIERACHREFQLRPKMKRDAGSMLNIEVHDGWNVTSGLVKSMRRSVQFSQMYLESRKKARSWDSGKHSHKTLEEHQTFHPQQHSLDRFWHFLACLGVLEWLQRLYTKTMTRQMHAWKQSTITRSLTRPVFAASTCRCVVICSPFRRLTE